MESPLKSEFQSVHYTKQANSNEFAASFQMNVVRIMTHADKTPTEKKHIIHLQFYPKKNETNIK